MQKTASIKLDLTEMQAAALAELQHAYANACGYLVALVVANRCWNRVGLHKLAYAELRAATPLALVPSGHSPRAARGLGAQMCCNVIFSVCKAYKAQKALGRITKDVVPQVSFRRASVHFDKRTYSLKGDTLSLYTLTGRIKVPMRPGAHQRRVIEAGDPREAELVCRKGQWFFNLVIEIAVPLESFNGIVVGVDVGENKLAACSTGKLWGGEQLRHGRDCHLAMRRRLQSNGSESARQLLRKVSGKESRHVRHVNHEVSTAIVAEAQRIGATLIAMEGLTDIRSRIRAGTRVRTRLHRWSFRQLQTFVAYKAAAAGIASIFIDPAYTSKTCSQCGRTGKRNGHRFVCSCGLRAHADLNASRNIARIGKAAALSRAAVDRPNVAVEMQCHVH